MTKSVMTSGIAVPRKYLYLDTQWPGVKGCQSLCGGVHWKIVTNVLKYQSLS